MRAAFQADLTVQDQYRLQGDVHHHLVHVIRIEPNEELLLLNGKGLMVMTKVVSISKKDLQLQTLSHSTAVRRYNLDLALGIPKKDALELSLKQAVELGFRRIYLVRSAYSQTKIPEADRILSMLSNALEQSNSAFLPEIISGDWKDIPVSEYSGIHLMDSQTKERTSRNSSAGSRLLIVGPEGGFSPGELAFLHGIPQVEILHLPTPILRTPTAVATGAGVILKTLLD